MLTSSSYATIAAVRPDSYKFVPSDVKWMEKTRAEVVPVASVFVGLKPDPKVIV
jgi:hypothetical protein